MRRVFIALFMAVMISLAARIMMPQRKIAPGGAAAAPFQEVSTPQRGDEHSNHQGVIDEQSIDRNLRSLLEAQAIAWNQGNIEDFMKGYWHSPQTVFVGSSGVQRGWETLLERYKRNYPGRAAMGQLTFSELEITPLGPDAAVILGHWHLKREKDAPGGVFTLIARRLPEGWRIIHDHTSATATPPAH
jgi:ketosteroid isomerase-like protein